MKHLIKRAWAWLMTWLLRRPRPLRVQHVEEFPDRINCRTTIYVAGEGTGHLWFVAMQCPCGCRDTLFMNLQDGQKPRWTVEDHDDGTATLSPSVWRKVGCRSHFFLRRGYWFSGVIPVSTRPIVVIRVAK